jgi:hypothetical protein
VTTETETKRPFYECPDCGNHFQSKAHKEACGEKVNAGPVEPPRSERGRRLRGEADLQRPIDQIRVIPGSNGVDATGAWAYYIRPDGATIRDALILCPNGGIPEMEDERLKARYGTNAEYYRNRQRRKGFEYVGPHLREDGIRRLLQVMEANREDEVLYLQEEMSDAGEVIRNSDRPEVRDQAKKRVRQLQRRLDTIQQGFDPVALESELKDIARAQQLAQVPPAVLRVMRSMIGEVNERVAEQVAVFQRGKGAGEASPARMFSGGGDHGADFVGKDSLEL